MKKEKLSKRTILIVSFLVMSVAFSAIILFVCYLRTEGRLESARQFIAGEESKIQYAIDSRLTTAKTLEMYVISQKGEITDFDEVASYLFAEDPGLRSVQLAPGGVVTYMYPREDTLSMPHDLFADPDRKDDVEKARDRNEIVLSGPLELRQGGRGLIARNPIFLTDEAGQSHFWGFSMVVFNIPEVFYIANLDLMTTENYYYRLWRYLPGSNEVQVIVENTDQELENAITEDIEVPNAVWYLDIAPQDKWVPRRMLVSEIAISATIMILIMFAISSHLTIRDQKEELLRQKAELIEKNHRDVLTGIKNGRFYMNRIRACESTRTPCSIFYLDLDNFKEINDNYGHDAGDKVLIAVAKRIAGCLGESDIAARIGGDEFTVTVVGNVTEGYCLELQERIRQSVTQPYKIGETELHPSVSIGFARYPDDADSVERVIRIADQRMYAEKREQKRTDKYCR